MWEGLISTSGSMGVTQVNTSQMGLVLLHRVFLVCTAIGAQTNPIVPPVTALKRIMSSLGSRAHASGMICGIMDVGVTAFTKYTVMCVNRTPVWNQTASRVSPVPVATSQTARAPPSAQHCRYPRR